MNLKESNNIFVLVSCWERWLIFGRPRQDEHLKMQTNMAPTGSSKPACLRVSWMGCHVWHQFRVIKDFVFPTSGKHCLFSWDQYLKVWQLGWSISGRYSFSEIIKEFSGMLHCCIPESYQQSLSPTVCIDVSSWGCGYFHCAVLCDPNPNSWRGNDAEQLLVHLFATQVSFWVNCLFMPCPLPVELLLSFMAGVWELFTRLNFYQILGTSHVVSLSN